MIHDLDKSQKTPELREADDLVIGAGIAGCLVATRLAQRGRRVVLIESGGEKQVAATHPLNSVEQTGQAYSGAEQGRFRCLGGTSTRWGGAMIPFMRDDVESHPLGWTGAWGIPYDRLLGHVPEIEQLFRLPPGDYDDHGLLRSSKQSAGNGLVARCAKWPRFALRNVAAALGTALRSPAGPDVWLNAHAVDFDFKENGALDAVTAKSPGGRVLRVKAANVVVSAGAIESTRILLLVDRRGDGRVFSPDNLVGRYFNDHLSAPVADIEPVQPEVFNRAIGFRFQRGGMRNVRFELAGAVRRQAKLPAGFAHVAYEPSEKGDGFSALRSVYQAIQAGERPALRDVAKIANEMPWFARAAWWRYAERRVLYPSSGRLRLHLVAEQEPRFENCITLASDKTDVFGVPKASINWRVSSGDIDVFEAMSRVYLRLWRESSLSDLAITRPHPVEQVRESVGKADGIFHPAGTIRVGSGPSSGVVDAGLRTFRVPNLHVVSTAVFPTAAGSNPTLMMMLYACDLGARLGWGG